jgi:hypothetical protein
MRQTGGPGVVLLITECCDAIEGLIQKESIWRSNIVGRRCQANRNSRLVDGPAIRFAEYCRSAAQARRNSMTGDPVGPEVR